MSFKRILLYGYMKKRKQALKKGLASLPPREKVTLEFALEGAAKARKFADFFDKIVSKLMAKTTEGVQQKTVVEAGIPISIATPVLPNDKVILYIHGGANVMGLTSFTTRYTEKLAQMTQARVFAPEYRLSPEHQFPAALDDVFEIYKFLLHKVKDSNKIIVMGDSSGGNLTLTLLLKLKDANFPMPSAAITFSAQTDARMIADSITTREPLDPWLTSPDPQKRLGRFYLGDASVENPLISPLLGDLSGLPPLLIMVGGQEILYDDSVNFAAKAAGAGVDVTLDVQEDMFHVYQIFFHVLDEAKVAMGKVALFIKMKT